MDKVWQIYIGDSWIGTLTPTGSDDVWYYAEFAQGDAWGNFAPWFVQALEAHQAEDDATWQSVYSQITMMGLIISSEDGESYPDPALHIDGDSAWFVV